MVIDKCKAMKILIARKIRKRLKRRPREVYIRPIFFNRHESGESILVKELREDKEYHHKYFRMTKANFDHILLKVWTALEVKRKTHSRPINPTEKLAITLRYLASGNSQISLSMSYRISPTAIHKLLRETMEAICDVFGQDHLPVPSTQTWVDSEREFSSMWNFPNCCGAIDGKHIRIKAPPLSGSMNFNYKGYFSMVLLAIVDANYRFILVDIGASGSQSDGGVLSRSPIGKALIENTLQLPETKHVQDELLPHVIVGDEAFPLRSNLLMLDFRFPMAPP